MINDELPLGFMFALSGNKYAMQSFAARSDEEQKRIVARARGANSKEEMQIIVDSLSDRDEMREFS